MWSLVKLIFGEGKDGGGRYTYYTLRSGIIACYVAVPKDVIMSTLLGPERIKTKIENKSLIKST